MVINEHGLIGLGFLGLTLSLLIHYAWNTHRLKTGAKVRKARRAKRAAILIRLRNSAVVLASSAFTVHFFMRNGVTRLTPDEAGYAPWVAIMTSALIVGLVLCAAVLVLSIVIGKPEFDFWRLARREADKTAAKKKGVKKWKFLRLSKRKTHV